MAAEQRKIKNCICNYQPVHLSCLETLQRDLPLLENVESLKVRSCVAAGGLSLLIQLQAWHKATASVPLSKFLSTLGDTCGFAASALVVLVLPLALSPGPWQIPAVAEIHLPHTCMGCKGADVAFLCV